MVEYRRSAHAVTDLKYHVIWVTKYRYKILRGDIAERARDLLRQICMAREVTIIRGAVSPDHIHMLVAAPPQLSPSKLVQFLKGRSSRLAPLPMNRSALTNASSRICSCDELHPSRSRCNPPIASSRGSGEGRAQGNEGSPSISFPCT